jgi:hypothetical protein
MGLEPTTLPREVAPSALNFARLNFWTVLTTRKPM